MKQLFIIAAELDSGEGHVVDNLLEEGNENEEAEADPPIFLHALTGYNCPCGKTVSYV